jgi:hypothetical protein
MRPRHMVLLLVWACSSPDAGGELESCDENGMCPSGFECYLVDRRCYRAGMLPRAVTCADGARDGLTDSSMFPDIAACAGTWTGDVSTAGPICGAGAHVCRGGDAPLMTVAYAQATAFPGCFAIDTAHDNGACTAGCTAAVMSGIDTAELVDMGGMGADCPYKLPGFASCLMGGRIDASQNSGTGCITSPA